MTAPPTRRVRRTDAPLESLQIGPEEYFVLSRADGPTTVGELVGGTGLPTEQVAEIVERLVQLGALALVDPDDAPPPPRRTLATGSGAELRKRADSRRRLLLQQQFGAGAARPRETTPPPSPSTASPAPEAKVPAEVPPAAPVVRPVAADDPRLEADCAVPMQDQRWLLALDDRFDALTPFEILGLQPTDDDKEIKRAYFDASRRLHPDAYFGKNQGRYKAILSKLFARAKQAYGELRKPEVRRPYVEAYLGLMRAEREREEATRKAELEVQQAEARARKQAETEALRRRSQKQLRERARAREHRLRNRLDDQLEEHLEEAVKAQEVGNLARAANFFRLALQADPHNEEIRERWETARGAARKERAKVAFARGRQFAEYGQSQEAVPLLTEAADCDPTAEHLAFAAEAVRDADPLRARGYALSALQALNVALAPPKPVYEATEAARLRIMIARAFAAAGQKKTALEQGQLAKLALPDDLELRSLLKSLKVT